MSAFDDMTEAEQQMYADTEDPPVIANSRIVEAVACPACESPRGVRCNTHWDHDARIAAAIVTQGGAQ